MSERKLYILGTACLVPTKQRNQNGYFLRWDNEGFLFDPGEGTQRQLIYAGISVSQITKIFISHFHGDHCLGLPGVVQRMSLDQVKHPVQIYYPAPGQSYFDNLMKASIFFQQHELVPCPIQNSGVVFENQDYKIEAISLDHTIVTYGFRLQEFDSCTLIPEKLAGAGVEKEQIKKLKCEGSVQINNKIINLHSVSKPRSGQSFAYLLDTRFCQQAIEIAKNVDLLLCEATYLSDRKVIADQYGHLTARQAAEIAEWANVKKLVLTHFSQIYANADDFVNEAKAIFANVSTVADGDVVFLPRRKRILKSTL